jgi:hypothetical protein
VLIGLVAWFAPAIVVALILGWAILQPSRGRHAPRPQATDKPGSTQPPQETQLSGEEKPPSGI